MSTIVLGITGSIAAYKAAELASRLAKRGHDVHAVLTRSAAKLVTPATFHPLTGNLVQVEVFDESHVSSEARVEHVGLADRADVVAIAPATAHVIARIAAGLADDFLTTLVLAFSGPVVLAPAMNDNMYGHPAVRRNIETLRSFGYRFVDPESGDLACGRSGVGRLADLERIVLAIEEEAKGAKRRGP
jgi:phosphopantothenoylcysteine decarboxylase/phosphopantothenate--cysteine ligase